MFDIRLVLGSADAEMEAIARLAKEAGVLTIQATKDGRPVRPGEKADAPDVQTGDLWIEVRPANETLADGQIIDHHDSDPHASMPPKEFLQASSIGQLIVALARLGKIPKSWHRGVGGMGEAGDLIASDECDLETGEIALAVVELGDGWVAEIPFEYVAEAAADHCIGAAFANKCPGIDPDPNEKFWKIIIGSRRRTFAPDLSDERFSEILGMSLETLFEAKDHPLLPGVADLTDLEIDGPVVAATKEQYPSRFQFGPLVGSIAGRAYIVRIRLGSDEIGYRINAASTASIQAWLNGVGEQLGCYPANAERPRNLFGVPARGFAGGTAK